MTQLCLINRKSQACFLSCVVSESSTLRDILWLLRKSRHCLKHIAGESLPFSGRDHSRYQTCNLPCCRATLKMGRPTPSATFSEEGSFSNCLWWYIMELLTLSLLIPLLGTSLLQDHGRDPRHVLTRAMCFIYKQGKTF